MLIFFLLFLMDISPFTQLLYSPCYTLITFFYSLPGKLEDLTSQVQKSSNDVPAEDQFESEVWMTGGAYDFRGATTSLTNELLSSSKKVTLVRHGLSSWNEESRVQVCLLLSNLILIC